MAIRFFHLTHDYDNPVGKLPRVWQAYLAMQRQQGPTERKHPVAPEMCDWLDRRQAGLGLVGVIKRAARYLAIFLGCRCSEYLGPDIHWDEIIFVCCLRPMKKGAYCSWTDDFDGFMVTFRGSKLTSTTRDVSGTLGALATRGVLLRRFASGCVSSQAILLTGRRVNGQCSLCQTARFWAV